MLPDEQQANSRYVYELASGRFGWSLDKVEGVQAFHFKAGQGAKTGTGGHLPGNKVTGRIAEVRGLEPGEAAISPSRFDDLVTPEDALSGFANLAVVTVWAVLILSAGLARTGVAGNPPPGARIGR